MRGLEQLNLKILSPSIHCLPSSPHLNPSPMTSFSFFLFSFWLCHLACKILVPWPGIEPVSLAVEVRSPNHWTARESPLSFLHLFFSYLSPLVFWTDCHPHPTHTGGEGREGRSVLDHLQHEYLGFLRYHWMVFSFPGFDMVKGCGTPARVTLRPWPWQQQCGRGGEVVCASHSVVSDSLWPHGL